MNKDNLTDYELEILANVESYGVHITTVAADPPFSYSAGFEQSYHCPETIVFGLGYDTMASMVNRLGDCHRDGKAFRDGEQVEGILNGFPVVLKAIPTERITRDHFNSAMWLHKHGSDQPLSQAMQIVWPCDQTGLFPWDPNCPADVIEAQPPLYEGRSH